MIGNPDLVSYACIAHHPSFESSTILAEFNSADSNLQQIAKSCLELVPPHHKIFSHSFRNQSYTFLLHDRFVYFGIFSSMLIKSDQIRFLNHLKHIVERLVNSNGKTLSSYCLQGELHPIFHRLVSKNFDFGNDNDLSVIPPNGVHNNTPVSNPGKSKKGLSIPLLSPTKMGIGKGLMKKKKMVSEESLSNSRDGLVEGKIELSHESDYDGEVKSREMNHTNEGFDFMDNGGGRHKAKKIWRRHVWIVLVLDLAVCLILFGVWLFVCRGFQCIER